MASDPKNKPIHICIAAPCYGGLVHTHFMTSIIKLQLKCVELGVNLSYKFLTSESLITRARSILANHVYNDKGYTHMMFIDADIEFDADDIIRMLIADVDIIGGIYPKKHLKWEKLAKYSLEDLNNNENYKKILADFVVTIEDDTDKKGNIDINKPVEVKYVGTGLMLLKTSVLQKFVDSFPDDFMHLNNDKELVFRFFDCGVSDKKIYLSEDFWFCERWKSIGGKIYAALWTKTIHWGSYGYVGDFITQNLLATTKERKDINSSVVEQKNIVKDIVEQNKTIVNDPNIEQKKDSGKPPIAPTGIKIKNKKP